MIKALLLSGLILTAGAPTASGRWSTVSFPLTAVSALPPCTTADNCVLDCYATASAWECKTGAGAAVPVTQGVGTTFVATPWGYAAQIMSDAACPQITAADMETALGGATAFYDGDYSVIAIANPGFVPSAATIHGLWAHMDSDCGSRAYNTPTTTVATHIVSPTADLNVANARGRWAATILTVTAAGVQTVRAAGAEHGPDTRAATPGTCSNRLYVGRTDPVSGAGNFLSGQITRLRFYNRTWTAAERSKRETQAFGGIGSEGRVVTEHRASTAWTDAADGKVYAVASNLPRVYEGRGLRVDPTATNYWLNSTAIDTGKIVVNTPGVTANSESGPFSTVMGGPEADTLTDDNAAGQEGYYTTITAAPAGYAFSCYAKAGTATEAQAWLQTGSGTGNINCNWTLTADWNRYECLSYLGGAVGNVVGGIVVGHTAATTGSIVVAHCQLESHVYGGMTTSPIISGVTAVQRIGDTPTTDTYGWPTGDFHVCGSWYWPLDKAWTGELHPNYSPVIYESMNISSNIPGSALSTYSITYGKTTFNQAGSSQANNTWGAPPALRTTHRVCARRSLGYSYIRLNGGTESPNSTPLEYASTHHTPAGLGCYYHNLGTYPGSNFLVGYLSKLEFGP